MSGASPMFKAAKRQLNDDKWKWYEYQARDREVNAGSQPCFRLSSSPWMNLHQQHLFFGRERVKMTYVWKLTTQGSLGHPARVAPAHRVGGVGGVAVGVGVCAQVTGQTRGAHVACRRPRTCKMYTLQRQRSDLKTQAWSQYVHFAATKVASDNTDLIPKCTFAATKVASENTDFIPKCTLCSDKGRIWKHRLDPKMYTLQQQNSHLKKQTLSQNVHFAATKVATENTGLIPKYTLCSDKGRIWKHRLDPNMYTLQRQRSHLKTRTWSQNVHLAAT